MKRRFVVPFLAVLSLLVPLTAHAGNWVTKEIKWHKSSQGAPFNAGAIYVRDTTFSCIGPETADTTGVFSLNEAKVWRDGHAGAATTVDTTTVAYLLFQPDSGAAGTNTLSTLTVEVDGRVIGGGPTTALTGWAQVDSLVAKFNPDATGTGVISVPLRAVQGLGYPDDVAAGAYNYFHRIMSYDALRCRLTTGTGLVSGSVRAFIRYWDDD